jgi:hypothetical protein
MKRNDRESAERTDTREDIRALEAHRVARETALADACLVILALRKKYMDRGSTEEALAAIEACHREVQELLRP